MGNVAQLRTAPGEHHAAVDDVGCQLGRTFLQRGAHRARHRHERLLHGLGDLAGTDLHDARQARHLVAPAHFHRAVLLHGQCAADGDLDLLGGLLADEHVVLLAHVIHDRLVEAVAAYTHAAPRHNVVHGDDRGLGGAAAHVHHHVAGGRANGQPCTIGSSQWLGNQIGSARARLHGGVVHGAFLHTGNAARGADHDLGAKEGAPPAHHRLYEVAEHGFGDDEVGDDAIAHGTHDFDALRRAAEHVVRLVAHGDHSVVARANGHDRGLVHDNAAPFDVDQHVDRAEVYPDVLFKHEERRPLCPSSEGRLAT